MAGLATVVTGKANRKEAGMGATAGKLRATGVVVAGVLAALVVVAVTAVLYGGFDLDLVRVLSIRYETASAAVRAVLRYVTLSVLAGIVGRALAYAIYRIGFAYIRSLVRRFGFSSVVQW